MTATKQIELTPLSVERKTLQKKAGGTFEKIEITAELPNAGKVWLTAFPEKARGVTVGVPFWAIVKATPKTNGGYFYDFETVDSASTITPKPVENEPRTMSDEDAIRTLSLSLHAKLEQEFTKLHQKLDALLADKEMDDLTGGAIAKGF